MRIVPHAWVKRSVFVLVFCLLTGPGIFAQVTYQFSFSLEQPGGPVLCKAFFINYADGSAQARIRFTNPGSNDSALVDLKAEEEFTDKMTGCSSTDMLYYKLQKNQLVFGNDNGIILPAYFCFRKDQQSGLFEPYGFSFAIDDCKAPVTAFSSMGYLEKKDLTNDLVLTYFTSRDKFYTSLFAATRDITVSDRNLTMHLLVVANTFDQSIGNACAMDMRRALKFFQDLKEFIGIRFVFDTIAGKRYNLAEVEKAIEKLKNAGTNDIIVFYEIFVPLASHFAKSHLNGAAQSSV